MGLGVLLLMIPLLRIGHPFALHFVLLFYPSSCPFPSSDPPISLVPLPLAVGVFKLFISLDWDGLNPEGARQSGIIPNLGRRTITQGASIYNQGVYLFITETKQAFLQLSASRVSESLCNGGRMIVDERDQVGRVELSLPSDQPGSH